MLDAVLRDSLNKQVTNERFNAVFYSACAYRLELIGLSGLAHWMYDAAKDERQNAHYIVKYLIDRGEYPILATLDGYTAPNAVTLMTAGGVLFAEALKREQQTTQQINALYLLSDEVNDPQTCIFLHWFIEEQTRSEREVTELLAKLQAANNDAAAIIQLDHRVGKNV